MDKNELALKLALAVLEKEDHRVLGTGGDRSAQKVGSAAAELYNTIFAALNYADQKA